MTGRHRERSVAIEGHRRSPTIPWIAASLLAMTIPVKARGVVETL
jgi:hypothetical protein